MPKNKIGGSKHKKAKNYIESNSIRYKENHENYGKVIRILGNCRFTVLCDDGLERLSIMRGKFKKRKFINLNDIVLLEIWDFQDDKSSIIHVYNEDNSVTIQEFTELPADMINKVVEDDPNIGICSILDTETTGLNHNKDEIIDLKTKTNFSKLNKKEIIVFISAGGFGKRLQPLTNNLPKPMIKIDNVPILEIILNKFVNSGFVNFFISTHFKSNLIKKYFGNGDRFGANITYIEEKTPLGTVGSLSLIDIRKIKKPIILMNSDIITELNFDDLLEFHKHNKSDATICTSKYEYQIPYGEVISSNILVKELLEKPKKTTNINAGIYVLEKNIIKKLSQNKHMDMPDLLNIALKAKKRVIIFPLHEYWADIGQLDELNRVRKEISYNKK